MKKETHAEISYINNKGESVHSDICPPDCNFDNIKGNKDYIKLLYTCLDEWLNNSNGTGIFYIEGKLPEKCKK